MARAIKHCPRESNLVMMYVINTSDRNLVSLLWCEPCQKYEARIKVQKNFSSAWIKGQRTSSVVDHASSNQHKAAIAYLKADLAKANNKPVAFFSLITLSLMKLIGG